MELCAGARSGGSTSSLVSSSRHRRRRRLPRRLQPPSAQLSVHFPLSRVSPALLYTCIHIPVHAPTFRCAHRRGNFGSGPPSDLILPVYLPRARGPLLTRAPLDAGDCAFSSFFLSPFPGKREAKAEFVSFVESGRRG